MPSAEHRHVPAVVLEGQRRLEARGTELPDGRLLEVAGQLVVTPRPRDEEIPGDPVAPEPRLGEVRDPVRAGGSRTLFGARWSSQIEQRVHLFDDRVFPARLEERAAQSWRGDSM